MTVAGDTVFVGVDGGGSRCRVRVADRLGRIIATAEGGSANVSLDFDGALATIEAVLAEVAGQVGGERTYNVALGLAGAAAPRIAARAAGQLYRPRRLVAVVGDAVIACIGAHAGRDGGLVIAGTGSAALLRRGFRNEVIGGRGFLLGDDGSGAVMGRQAWRRALRAQDGLEPWTPLLRELMDVFAGDVPAVLAWARTAPSSAFAAYAPTIVAAAHADDPAGRALADEAGRAIGELVLALVDRGSPRTALVGGLAAPLRPFLPEAARARLSPPLRDALDGALILAGAPLVPQP